MNYHCWQVIESNHKSALDMCRKLLQEGKKKPVVVLLNLTELNLTELEKNHF